MSRRMVPFLLLIIAGMTVRPAFAAPDDLSAQQIAAIRSAVTAKLARDHIPGASIAVARGNRVIWAAGFGHADIENRIQAISDTAYRSASIGKPMTAVAAMTLVEAGRLDLDSPVQRYCSRFPEKRWPITVRQLLNHTSGIRHYLPATEEQESYLVRHYEDAVSPLEIFENDPLLFAPGEQSHYSTWGYVLLGCVIEGAAGSSYLDYMQRAIFRRAGMTRTRDDDPRAIIPDRARGYVWRDGHVENSRHADMSGKLAAGGFITTAPDLARFGLAFANDRLVSAASRQLMLRETRLANGDTVNYGLGWLINEHRGIQIASHGGGTPQVTGLLLVAPAQRLSIAILFNLEDVPDRTELGHAILEIVMAAGAVGDESQPPERR